MKTITRIVVLICLGCLGAYLYRPSNTDCQWQFNKYQPSDYEKQWFNIISRAQHAICEEVELPEHAEASRAIVSRVEQLKSTPWKHETIKLQMGDIYMSQMHYRACGMVGVQLIEPLWGMLRDPFDEMCGKMKLTIPGYHNPAGFAQSKEHIMPQGYAPWGIGTSLDDLTWHSHGIPPWMSLFRPGAEMRKPRNVHLDLGASYFDGFHLNNSYVHGLAASGTWFYETYHKPGIKFDSFVAVELVELNDTEVYKHVPDDLIGKYSLINTGLSMDNDKMNTISLIKRMVEPEDFFVFKLDIDGAPIEEPIVQALLADDDASSRVDELMFEHHVKFNPMAGVWGMTNVPDSEALTLEDSYKLFRGLRRKGIRAHSWP